MTTLAVKDLNKSYTPGQQIVKNVNFSLSERGFLTLLGPSGCGKSTILRLIAGLESPTSGEILLDGRRINELQPAERDIAMVFQSYALYPHMSCFENMAVSLRLHKIPASEINKRVNETAELLGVTELLGRNPRQLSGGQRQRIALGRAIVRKPKVMLLDEPLSNLDAQLRERMRTELKKLFRDINATVVFVTHDQTEALSMSDTIVVINNGLLQQQGSPEEIYHRPANIFVGGFLGSPRINTLRGHYRDGKFIHADFELNGFNGPADTELLLGVRPEDIGVLTAPAAGAIMGLVELIEPLGMHSKIVVRIGSEMISALTNDRSIQSGQSVWLNFDRDRLHLFSVETGSRIL